MQYAQPTEAEKQYYSRLVDEISPNSKTLLNCANAFWTGGAICCAGQFITNIFSNMGYTFDQTSMAASVILIFLSALLTGMGVYDDIGKVAGAGSIVPITGFANTMVAPALEFKKEGYIFGVGSKLFVIAGPVIVYGTATSVIVGIIYYYVNLLS